MSHPSGILYHFFKNNCSSKSKIAVASKERKLAFLLFRAPKVFEAKPQRSCKPNAKQKARFHALLRRSRFSRRSLKDRAADRQVNAQVDKATWWRLKTARHLVETFVNLFIFASIVFIVRDKITFFAGKYRQSSRIHQIFLNKFLIVRIKNAIFAAYLTTKNCGKAYYQAYSLI